MSSRRTAGKPRGKISARASCMRRMTPDSSQPADVTPDSLRHTYVAFLIRQGIRFTDLARLVGRIPADLLGAYSALATNDTRVSLESVDITLPAVAALQAG